MIRRLAIRTATVLAALAAAGVAVALPDERKPDGPAILLTKATAPLAHSNSQDGAAILTATNMKPGDMRQGEVVVVNRASAGDIHLVGTVPASGRLLADRLTLTIEDKGGRGVVAEGSLAATAACLPLGRFEASESRAYRFVVRFPDGGPGADNRYAGASTRVDYEWLQASAASDRCSVAAPLDLVQAESAPPAQAGFHDVELGDMKLAIEPGPYRFSRRSGTARVGVHCVASDSGTCRGRLQLERRTSGQGRGLAMAVGTFSSRAGDTKKIVLRLNRRARRRITSTGTVAVRAYVTAKDSRGREHRVAYRDKLTYGRRGHH